MAKSDIGLRELPDAYLAVAIPHNALSVVAAIWSNRNYHKFFAMFWPLDTLGYLSITTLTEIAA